MGPNGRSRESLCALVGREGGREGEGETSGGGAQLSWPITANELSLKQRGEDAGVCVSTVCVC